MQEMTLYLRSSLLPSYCIIFWNSNYFDFCSERNNKFLSTLNLHFLTRPHSQPSLFIIRFLASMAQGYKRWCSVHLFIMCLRNKKKKKKTLESWCVCMFAKTSKWFSHFSIHLQTAFFFFWLIFLLNYHFCVAANWMWSIIHCTL